MPTLEVWESSSRIEKKLDDLRDEQKRHEKKSAERHRTVKWALAALAVLIIAGIMWFKLSTQAIITDPKILRVKLAEKIEQTFQQTRKELLARKAETSEINALYSWHDTALERLDESVEFIETAAAGNRSSIVQKAAVTLQERGVDQALKELTAMLDEEGKRNKERSADNGGRAIDCTRKAKDPWQHRDRHQKNAVDEDLSRCGGPSGNNRQHGDARTGIFVGTIE